jgi:hypothetical protein
LPRWACSGLETFAHARRRGPLLVHWIPTRRGRASVQASPLECPRSGAPALVPQ